MQEVADRQGPLHAPDRGGNAASAALMATRDGSTWPPGLTSLATASSSAGKAPAPTRSLARLSQISTSARPSMSTPISRFEDALPMIFIAKPVALDDGPRRAPRRAAARN